MVKGNDFLKQLLSFFDKTNDYITILKALLNGYQTFMRDLKGGEHGEKDE